MLTVRGGIFGGGHTALLPSVVVMPRWFGSFDFAAFIGARRASHGRSAVLFVGLRCNC
jgi:hypothetical protein